MAVTGPRKDRVMAKKDHRKTVNIDVGFPLNKKLKGASPATKWLGVVAVCWAGQNLTNGQIEPAVVCAVAGVPMKHARDLINRDLWHEKGHHCEDCQQPDNEGEVVIHHYLEFQTSAEKVTRIAIERSLSGRKANHIRHKHKGSFEECWECQP